MDPQIVVEATINIFNYFPDSYGNYYCTGFLILKNYNQVANLLNSRCLFSIRFIISLRNVNFFWWHNKMFLGLLLYEHMNFFVV